MKNLLDFLQALKVNNNREWFQANKGEYQHVEVEFKKLVSNVEERLQQIDQLDVHSTKVYRIYRDVRFAKDKRPYHIHRSVSFKRATEELRGGYYLRIEKGVSYIAGGFFGPEPSDLLHIRKQMQQDPQPIREILALNDYTQYFSGLEGERVKTSPKGFDKADPAISVLHHQKKHA